MAHSLLSSDTHDESHFEPLNYAQIHRATKYTIYNMYIYIMGSNPQKNLNLLFIQVRYRLHCKRFLAVSLCAPPTCTFSCIKLLDLSTSWLCTGFMFTKKNNLDTKMQQKREQKFVFLHWHKNNPQQKHIY